MAEILVPNLADDVTAEWIGAVLARHRGGSAPAIAGIELGSVGEGVGFLSDTLRVAIDYAEPEPELPGTVIVKLLPPDAIHRDVERDLHGFEREIRFYRDIAPALPLRVPRVFFAEIGDEASALVMEDLGTESAGDQVEGLRHDQVISTVREVARLHARYWNKAEGRHLDWMPEHDHFFREGFEEHWPAFVDDYGEYISLDALELGECVASCLVALEERIEKRPKTMIHGDLRGDNLLFDRANAIDEVLIIDWQLVHRGFALIDVARLFGGSEPVLERAGHQHEVFAAWHDALVEGGVRDYSYEEGLDDMRLAALHCLAIPVKSHFLSGGKSTGRARILLDAIVERMFASALELEADRMLP